MSMLGLDKLFKSIAGLFGMSTETLTAPKTDDKKPQVTPVQSAQNGVKESAERTQEKLELVKNKYWDVLVSKGWITDATGQKAKFEKLWATKS